MDLEHPVAFGRFVPEPDVVAGIYLSSLLWPFACNNFIAA